MKERPLEDGEQRFLTLLRAYEKALDEHRLTFSIQLTEEAAEPLLKGSELGFYSLLKVAEIRDVNGLPALWVKFQIGEFEKYVHFILSQAGMALLSNYKLVLRDNFSIEV